VIPDDLRYTSEHEGVRTGDGGRVRVGITHYAQDALGDVVFVSLPDTGTSVTAGQACGEVESTKSVSEIYAPVSGEVVARNDALDAHPDLVNSDPYGEGWLVEIATPDEGASVADLLDAAAYAQLTNQG
jgi:glycine cleavage system H protein